MKITINKDEIESAINAGIRFVSTKLSNIESLQGGRLVVIKGKIRLFTTNLNDFFVVEITGKTLKDGETIFDIKKAAEFLSLLSPGDIEISTEENELLIKQGKTKGRFKTYPSEDFPIAPEIKSKGKEIKKETIEKISKVTFSASKDEARPVLTGILYIKKGKQAHLVTTDGFRLSVQTISNNLETEGIIIPSKIILDIIKISKANITMFLDEEARVIRFTFDKFSITSRLLDGEFPPYEKVLPSLSETIITLKKDELIKSVRLISVFARDEADIVVLDIKKEGIYLKPKQTKEGTGVFQELIKYKGTPMKIAFNYKYILEFLNNAESENVVLEFNQSTSPGVFKEENNNTFIHVIMPLRIDETS